MVYIVLHPEMIIHRDNLLPIIIIAQNSFDLSITDVVLVIYFVIAISDSCAHSVQTSKLVQIGATEKICGVH